MADKFINETGLQTIKTWIKNTFALDADLDALDAKVDDIIAEGGEPNVIETVKVNGNALTPDAQKAVDITVPTKNSDLTNDSNFQNETQVQALINAKLTSVYKPGGTVEFASLPALVKENVGYIYDVMDSFTTTNDFVEGAGKTYPAHTNVGIIDKGAAGYFYDVFSGMVDLTNYWTNLSGQSNTLEAMTVAEINAILNA